MPGCTRTTQPSRRPKRPTNGPSSRPRAPSNRCPSSRVIWRPRRTGGRPTRPRWSATKRKRRSEERRVGEEGRTRWSPYHLKKKKEEKKTTPLFIYSIGNAYLEPCRVIRWMNEDCLDVH